MANQVGIRRSCLLSRPVNRQLVSVNNSAVENLKNYLKNAFDICFIEIFIFYSYIINKNTFSSFIPYMRYGSGLGNLTIHTNLEFHKIQYLFTYKKLRMAFHASAIRYIASVLDLSSSLSMVRHTPKLRKTLTQLLSNYLMDWIR